MAIFRKKNKKKELKEAAKKARQAKLKELKEIIKKTDFSIPKKQKLTMTTKEYGQFLKETKARPKNLYERATAFSEILNINPSKQEALKMKADIDTGYLNVSPTGVLSLTIIIFLLFLIASILTFVLGFTFLFFMVFLSGVIISYLIYNHPSSNAKVITARMSADSVLAVLYMVIYMYISPNLEGALKFASENLKGPLSWDLKKLVWDINVGVYSSADAALAKYAAKWKKLNTEFADALNLLRTSAVKPARREKLLDEIINIILRGTAERTKHYVYGLRMPVMIIHAMGILLPVMGLVLFPIVLILMADAVKPIFIAFGYNVVLPVFLWFLIDYILKSRPPTFSQPDISLAKNIPPLGKVMIGNKIYPILPIALLISIPITLLGIYFTITTGSTLSSLMIICGISSGIIIYCALDSMQKMKLRNDIEKIESEFPVALFHLGNSLSSGMPIESSIDKSVENMEEAKISKLFKSSSLNMRRFGYTFEESLFDKKIGAVWLFPSRLIRSILGIIIESSKKSMKVAAKSMVTISRYLKGTHDVKEEISSILGETIASMTFMANILVPMISGVTITMAIIIIQILSTLSEQMQTIMIQSPDNMAQGMFMIPWIGAGGIPIGPAFFQLIVGIYMIETVTLLAFFINRVEYGEDKIGLRRILYRTLLIAVFIYIVSWGITHLMFGSSIQSLLTPSIG